MRGPQYHRRLPGFALTGLAALLCWAGPAAADDDPGALLASAHAAVVDGNVVQSRLLGFNDPNKQFAELPPDGAVLIGFDLGVGKFINTDVIYAVRGIYLTRGGETMLGDHGLFRDRRTAKGKILKSKVLRTVHVQARPGYAVGGVTVRSGLVINGLSATFMRIDGLTLDPGQSYTSEWVGDRTGGGEATITCDGLPAIGLFGSQDDEHASALGLYFSNQPAPAAAPPAVLPPVDRPADPLKAQPPADPPHQEAADLAPREKAAAPPAPARESTGTMWSAYLIPGAIFGGVTVVVFGVALVFSGRKAPVGKRPVRPRSRIEPRSAVAVLPPPPASTALCVSPVPILATQPPCAEEEVLDLRPEDVVSEEVLELRPEDLDPEPEPLSSSARWPRLEL